MEFELSCAWFELTDQNDRNKIDSVSFFEFVDKIINGEYVPNDHECIRIIQDGDELVWANPKESNLFIDTFRKKIVI